MSRLMIKEKSGFKELLRSFFSSEYDEEEVLQEVTAEEKRAWKAALANSDKIMEETNKSGKKAGKKIVETVEVSETIEKKQAIRDKRTKEKEMEIGE